jgi:predicted heme/steroid binding protein
MNGKWLCSREFYNFYSKKSPTLRDRLMVGHRPLEAGILVRLQVSEDSGFLNIMKQYILLAVIYLAVAGPVFALQTYTIQDVSQHNSSSDCYVVFSGTVYNLTNAHIQMHDGYLNIRPWCGKDITSDFQTKAGSGSDHSQRAYSQLAGFAIGQLSTSTTTGTPTSNSNSTATVNSTSPTATTNALGTDNKTGEATQKTKNPYNFWWPFGLTFGAYAATYFLMKSSLSRKTVWLSLTSFKLFWNSMMLVSSLPSIVFGLYMILSYSFPSLRTVHFNFLYWHVEGGIIFSTLVVMHFLLRWVQYIMPLKVIKKNIQKIPPETRPPSDT